MSSQRLAQTLLASLLGASLLTLAACGSQPTQTGSSTAAPGAAGTAGAQPARKAIEAIARLQPTQGSTVSGTVRFVPNGDGSVRVIGTVQGLSANTEHGFHIHDKGDCSSGDGLSAGGHFNPTQQKHGKFDQAAHHTGDLPSLRSDAAGNARIDYVSRSIALDGGATSVVGRGLIVHKDPDDYTSQPTGNSGARLACAVIERGA